MSNPAVDSEEFDSSPNTNPQADNPLAGELALELLKQNREGHTEMVKAIRETAEISRTGMSELRDSTAEEAREDRKSSRRDMRSMMALIALFGALIAALSGLNIMLDSSGDGLPSVTIEGSPNTP